MYCLKDLWLLWSSDPILHAYVGMTLEYHQEPKWKVRWRSYFIMLRFCEDGGQKLWKKHFLTPGGQNIQHVEKMHLKMSHDVVNLYIIYFFFNFVATRGEKGIFGPFFNRFCSFWGISILKRKKCIKWKKGSSHRPLPVWWSLIFFIFSQERLQNSKKNAYERMSCVVINKSKSKSKSESTPCKKNPRMIRHPSVFP